MSTESFQLVGITALLQRDWRQPETTPEKVAKAYGCKPY